MPAPYFSKPSNAERVRAQVTAMLLSIKRRCQCVQRRCYSHRSWSPGQGSLGKARERRAELRCCLPPRRSPISVRGDPVRKDLGLARPCSGGLPKRPVLPHTSRPRAQAMEQIPLELRRGRVSSAYPAQHKNYGLRHPPSSGALSPAISSQLTAAPQTAENRRPSGAGAASCSSSRTPCSRDSSQPDQRKRLALGSDA